MHINCSTKCRDLEINDLLRLPFYITWTHTSVSGLVKILKKYDKRTGALIRLPFIQKVLQQPFFTTDVLYKLVKECERLLDLLSPETNPSNASTGDSEELCGPTTSSAVDGLLKSSKELGDIEKVECMYMRSTISALRALKEIRSGSSTVSMFSLPPLQFTGGVESAWKKIPVLEQVAKWIWSVMFFFFTLDTWVDCECRVR